MNRILFDKSEINDSRVEVGGLRADHIIDILHGEVGQILKTGEVDGPIGKGTILSVDREKRLVKIALEHNEKSLEPWIDLILAPPRPRVMKRLLPQLATMGAGRIVLVGANKVEKDFWGATLLKDENMRALLIEGLMQAGTSILPHVEIRRNLGAFIRDELDTMFLSSQRILAHPGECSSLERISTTGRILLAVGPEGGWTGKEIDLFESKAFTRYSLGKRILKTETACIALMARLNEGNR